MPCPNEGMGLTRPPEWPTLRSATLCNERVQHVVVGIHPGGGL